jgi:hypothetical protein
MFVKELLIVPAPPVPAIVDELAAPLVVIVALAELPLPLALLPALRALIATTVPPCTSAGALLELVPCAADL